MALISSNMKPINLVKDANHKLFKNDEELGHYLAGLIEADGCFCCSGGAAQLIIAFCGLDESFARYLVSLIGYGHVYKVSNKDAWNLVIGNKAGIIRVIKLINGKIRGQSKLNQIRKVLALPRYSEIKDLIIKLNISNDFNNYWLAGFTDGDGSFQIKILYRKNRIEIRIALQIDQKTDFLLKLIQSFFGGNIGYRQKTDTYYYSSTSFHSAISVVNYFEKYNLMSSKYLNWLKWLEVYKLIQSKQHLTKDGIAKITAIKNSMNSASPPPSQL